MINEKQALNINLFILAVLLFAWALIVPGAKCLSANITNPSDYCYVQSLTISNNTGSDLINKPIRVPKNTADLISANTISGENDWAFSLTNSSLDNIEFLITSYNNTATPFWIVAPNIPNGGSVTYNLFYGNNTRVRDNGLSFEYDSYARVLHNNNMNLGLNSDWQVVADLRVTDSSKICPDPIANPNYTANIIDKYNESGYSGFQLYFVCSNGNPYITGRIANGQNDIYSVTKLWSSSFDNLDKRIELKRLSTGYLQLLIDGSIESSVSANLNMANNVDHLDIGGTELNATVLRNAGIEIGNDQLSTWTFDSLQETSAVSPNYQYSFSDYAQGNNPGTYYKNYDSTNIFFSLSTPNSDITEIETFVTDISGFAFQNVNALTSTNQFNPIIPISEPLAQGLGLPPAMTYTLLFSFLGLLMVFGVYIVAPNPILGLIAFSVPVSGGVISGLLPPVTLYLFMIVGLFSWGFSRWVKNN